MRPHFFASGAGRFDLAHPQLAAAELAATEQGARLPFQPRGGGVRRPTIPGGLQKPSSRGSCC
jgi:hypothetical protein